ncbi:Peptidase S10 [Macleaya cordata]|uniref:Peptidase S10 n=1 Tax=Macleaya cordata TaxID=56857 RepID=A0A200QJJ9_MACCD|nr:Peptidase S10 [Macleaya cordata]
MKLASSNTTRSFSQSTISYLPGFTGPLPFHLETGYIGVDETEDVQLFYYFVRSERNAKEDPLLLWLTGGPGCSAFSGLVFEIGPLKFEVVEYNGSLPTLVPNPHSWTKAASIIFLDQPVGTGFSYSKSSEGWMTGDLKSTEQVYQFLRKWLINHPELLRNPVYVGGDSYSGFTVPLVVQDISDGNEAGNEPFINLKGYLLGNPVTDPIQEQNSKVPFSHGMGLISDELYESLKKSCAGEYTNVNPSNTQCLKDLQAYYKCILGINTVHILEPICYFLASPETETLVPYKRSLRENLKQLDDPKPPLRDPPAPSPECRSYAYLLSAYWINDKNVRKALHVRDGTVQQWQRCSDRLSYKNEISSSLRYHLTLSERGYRSLIYSGDHDITVTFIGTQAWIKSLNYSIIDDWRPWFVDAQIGGYTRTYSNNMTFATLKGAGHTAPEYNPKEGFEMFKRWMDNEAL